MDIYGSAFSLKDLSALEILDSRGNPTLRVDLTLADGTPGPRGRPLRRVDRQPRGRRTARRRQGPVRRQGLPHGRRATSTASSRELALSKKWASLDELDHAMIALDGTPNKARLGANAIVGVSMAVARALSATVPLYEVLNPTGVEPKLPVPHFNVLNGGAHAPNLLDFQEFMIAPMGAPTITEAVRAGAAVYGKLRGLLKEAGFATGLGDEGGFAPDLERPEDVLALIVKAIEAAGYAPGKEGVAIALDPAASEFYKDGAYVVIGREAHERRHGGAVRGDREGLPRVVHRGRPRRGRLGRLEGAHRPARRHHPDHGRRPLRHQPRHHHRGHREGRRQLVAHQAQPDRLGERDARGDAAVPRGRVHADGVPPLRRDGGQLHRGPHRGLRVRPAQVGRARARRARREVQPPDGDRGRDEACRTGSRPGP